MYCSHFGMHRLPFNNTPDPTFYYRTAEHEEALATLQYATTERKGFVLVTGEVGAGKTLIGRMFLRHVEQQATTAVITNTHLTGSQMLEALCLEFGLDVPENAGTLALNQCLQDYLLEQFAQDRYVIVLVDEAQNLPDESFEELRMLGNLEADDAKLLQVCILGQPELRERFRQPDMRQLDQRLFCRFHLEPLRTDQVTEYIMHRLRVAGFQGSELFTTEAVELINSVSQGIPRLINQICDNALLTAYGQDRTIVDADIIQQVLDREPSLRADTEPAEVTVQSAAAEAKASTAEAPAVRMEQPIPRPEDTDQRIEQIYGTRPQITEVIADSEPELAGAVHAVSDQAARLHNKLEEISRAAASHTDVDALRSSQLELQRVLESAAERWSVAEKQFDEYRSDFENRIHDIFSRHESTRSHLDEMAQHFASSDQIDALREKYESETGQLIGQIEQCRADVQEVFQRVHEQWQAIESRIRSVADERVDKRTLEELDERNRSRLEKAFEDIERCRGRADQLATELQDRWDRTESDMAAIRKDLDSRHAAMAEQIERSLQEYNANLNRLDERVDAEVAETRRQLESLQSDLATTDALEQLREAHRAAIADLARQFKDETRRLAELKEEIHTNLRDVPQAFNEKIESLQSRLTAQISQTRDLRQKLINSHALIVQRIDDMSERFARREELEALRETQQHEKGQVLAEIRRDREDLAAIDDRKADRQELRDVEQQKADRSELDAISRAKADRNEVAEVDRRKADRQELQDIEGRKADRDELHALREEQQYHAADTADRFEADRSALEDIDRRKADRDELAAIDRAKAGRDEIQALRDEHQLHNRNIVNRLDADAIRLAEVDQRKADRDDLKEVDDRKANRDDLNSLRAEQQLRHRNVISRIEADRSDIESLEKRKAGRDELGEIEQRKADREELGALRDEHQLSQRDTIDRIVAGRREIDELIDALQHRCRSAEARINELAGDQADDADDLEDFRREQQEALSYLQQRIDQQRAMTAHDIDNLITGWKDTQEQLEKLETTAAGAPELDDLRRTQAGEIDRIDAMLDAQKRAIGELDVQVNLQIDTLNERIDQLRLAQANSHDTLTADIRSLRDEQQDRNADILGRIEDNRSEVAKLIDGVMERCRETQAQLSAVAVAQMDGREEFKQLRARHERDIDQIMDQLKHQRRQADAEIEKVLASWQDTQHRIDEVARASVDPATVEALRGRQEHDKSEVLELLDRQRSETRSLVDQVNDRLAEMIERFEALPDDIATTEHVEALREESLAGLNDLLKRIEDDSTAHQEDVERLTKRWEELSHHLGEVSASSVNPDALKALETSIQGDITRINRRFSDVTGAQQHCLRTIVAKVQQLNDRLRTVENKPDPLRVELTPRMGEHLARLIDTSTREHDRLAELLERAGSVAADLGQSTSEARDVIGTWQNSADGIVKQSEQLRASAALASDIMSAMQRTNQAVDAKLKSKRWQTELQRGEQLARLLNEMVNKAQTVQKKLAVSMEDVEQAHEYAEAWNKRREQAEQHSQRINQMMQRFAKWTMELSANMAAARTEDEIKRPTPQVNRPATTNNRNAVSDVRWPTLRTHNIVGAS